jgi:hypothetical protein
MVPPFPTYRLMPLYGGRPRTSMMPGIWQGKPDMAAGCLLCGGLYRKFGNIFPDMAAAGNACCGPWVRAAVQVRGKGELTAAVYQAEHKRMCCSVIIPASENGRQLGKASSRWGRKKLN